MELIDPPLQEGKIQKGFKFSEVGIIPEDWIAEKLENFFSYISYGFTNPMPMVENGVYLITAKNIYDGKIQYDSARFTTQNAYKKLLTEKSKPKLNDILLTKDGSLGRLAIVDRDDICINQSVAVMRPNNRVSALYLKLLLESPKYQKIMLDNAGGSTIKHIYITIVNLMPIGIPKFLSEQTAIATALSDADALISSLEKLIAKKKLIKQGAMQELLRPKDGWETKKIGDVALIIRGASPRPIEDPRWFDKNSLIGWVRISDITKSKKYLTETTQKLSPSGIKQSRFVEAESLIMSICATVGKPVITKIPSCIHDGFVVFKNSQIDLEYLYYVLEMIEPLWGKNGQTGSQMNLNTGIINTTEIAFPKNSSSQREIANLFNGLDQELSGLEHKLNKACKLKQGMMQDLLTGRVRLV